MFDLKSKNWTCFYEVSVRYIAYRGEPSRVGAERRREEREKLKEAGFTEKDLRFHFKHLDADQIKAAAKKKARHMARKVHRKTGVIVEVCEGSYL